MAYIRGDFYFYSDGENLFIDMTCIPMKIMDEYVVMRYTQMTKQERLKAEKRALGKHYGNIGCDPLAKKYKKKTVQKMMREIIKKHCKT